MIFVRKLNLQPCYRQKKPASFDGKKTQLFLGKLDHFCVDQNCVFHSGWKAISSHVTGHLQPCYWQTKPAIFSLEFGPSLGIFVPIKWLFFHRKSAYLQLLYWQPKLTAFDRSPTIPRHFVATRRDILSQTMKFLCQILSRAQPRRYDKRD